MKILIVEDEALIRMELRDCLEHLGEDVVGEGQNGVEAISLAKELRPDVIVMDVNMPELNGIEAARQIQRLQIAPVVLLTAYSQSDLVEKAQESGVYGYLLKPYREDQLLPTLKMAVGRFSAEMELRKNLQSLQTTLEERKIIEKAKGILMTIYEITEDDAYGRMRSYSMKKGKPLSEVAQSIIGSYQEKYKGQKGGVAK